jgi:hypothetical protein
MTDEDARAIARATVREMLLTLGADPDEPVELQKDFAFVRAWRLSTETVKRQGLKTAVGVIVTAVLGLLWLAIHGRP